jgi:hypothetical protein
MVSLLALSGSLFAGSVTLAWDAVANAEGYHLCYGSDSGAYSDSLDVRGRTSATVSGLAEGKSFYFAVRAYAGTRTSDYSNEVKAVVRTSTGGGQLIPTLTIPAAGSTVNLTSEGTSDWVHWGKESSSSVNRKAGGTGEIGALTTVGGSASRFNATNRLRYSWSDGTPTASATTQAGLYIAGLNKGYQLQVPADTSERTLVVYLGGWQARGRLEVSLSDGSAPAFVQTVENLSAAFDRRLALTYRAGSAGQTLTVRYLQETSTGNITVQAATLQETNGTGN